MLRKRIKHLREQQQINMEEEEPIFDYTILDNNEYNYVRNVNIMYDKQAKLRNEHKLRKMNLRTFQAKI